MKRCTLTFIFTLLAIIAVYDMGYITPMLEAITARIPGHDKTTHVLVTGVLCVMVRLAFPHATFTVMGRSMLRGTILLWTFVTLEECSQMFVASRSFDLTDLACNYLGLILFGVAAPSIAGAYRARTTQTNDVETVAA
jgi:VanZ family protein